MKRNQNGFSHLLLIPILLVILGIVGYVGFIVWHGNRSTYREINDAEVPRIKHPGLDMAAFDPETNRAGDIVFWDTSKILGQLDIPFIEFGHVIPANSAGPEKINPQPTFITVPNAKVYSLIDGEVIKVEKIYSGDYTIHVAKGKYSWYVFETEHVTNPIVKVGDKVAAGQHIAQVSNYDAQNFDGNGVVEFGILLKGKPYAHLCPYKYLDESIKESVYSNLRSIYKAWNESRGSNIYDEYTAIPGCRNTDKVYEVER